MNRRLRTFLVWFLLLAIVAVAAFALDEDAPPPFESADVFEQDVAGEQIAKVTFGDGGSYVVTRDDGSAYSVRAADVPVEAWQALGEQGVEYEYPSLLGGLVGVVPSLVGVVLFLALLVWFFRRAQQQGAANIMQLRSHKAKKLVPGAETSRFSDIGGAAEAKERLADVVDCLKHPERWRKAGARMPRGVLLEGPPGCGKTLLARAVAGEAGVPFFVASASEFVEMFVGVGAARVRDLFENARKAAPAVIFLDELDAIGRKRGTGVGWGHDEREQTLNQLLVCLDGFERDGRLVVLAATNRADVLDKALLRPGRFDLRVSIPELDEAARLDVLRIHTRDKALAPEVSLEALARRTAGLNGAAIEQIANEAALEAVRRVRHGGGEATLAPADWDVALARFAAREKRFDAVDAVLLESASQLAEPVAAAEVRVTAIDGTVVEGRLVWADAAFVKVETAEGGRVVPKANVRHVEAIAGTAAVEAVTPDRWARG